VRKVLSGVEKMSNVLGSKSLLFRLDFEFVLDILGAVFNPILYVSFWFGQKLLFG